MKAKDNVGHQREDYLRKNSFFCYIIKFVPINTNLFKNIKQSLVDASC